MILLSWNWGGEGGGYLTSIPAVFGDRSVHGVPPLRGISTIGRPKPAKTQPKMKPLNLLEGYILRGYKNLTPNDVNRRNERFRGIAFQNIQKFSNRSSINIFLCRRKLMEKSKNPKATLYTGLRPSTLRPLLVIVCLLQTRFDESWRKFQNFRKSGAI